MLLSTAVEHQNQTLVATLRLPGAAIMLAYRSDTGIGRRAAFRVHLPRRQETDPAVRTATVTVAGQVHQIDPAATTWLWDGNDQAGRPVSGLQRVSIDLVTDAGSEHHEVGAGRWRAHTLGLGGWMLATGDALDPVARAIYHGNGAHSAGVEVQRRGPRLVATTSDGVRRVFDLTGRHLQTVDGWTGTASITCHYDDAGHLAEVRDRDGNRWAVERDTTMPTSLALRGPHGDRVALTVDEAGNLATVTTPSGAHTQLRWSRDGLLTGVTDAAGHQRQFSYDEDGRLARVDEGPLGSFSLARTNTTHGWAVARLGAEGRERRHTVERLEDGSVRRTSHCCGRSHPTLVERSGSTRRTTLPDGTVVVATEGGGRSVTRPSGTTTNLEVTSAPAGSAVPTVTRSLAGGAYTDTYDAATRTFTSTSPTGRVNQIVLDAAGRPIHHRDATGRTESHTYDERGRIIGRAIGDAHLVMVYDDDGRVASIRDHLGRTSWFDHDQDGRVVRQRLPDGRAIGIEFSPTGDVTGVIPPGRPATRSSFHASGQRAADHYPPIDGSTDPVTYGYDREGALVEIIRADGRRIGRKLGPGGALAALVTAEGTIHFQREPETGRVMQASTDETSLHYGWDGPLATSVEMRGLVAGRLDFDLDEALRVRGWTLAGTPPVAFVHDADGLVTGVGALSIDRDAGTGAVRARRLGMVTEERHHDPSGQLTGIDVKVGDRPLYAARRAYGPLGRLTSVYEWLQGREQTTEFRYDDADRIAEVLIDGQRVDRFTYDANGNRIERVGRRAPWTASYDERDRIVDAGGQRYEHTPDGELRSRSGPDGTVTYVHDSLGDLTEVQLPDGRRLRHHYDPHRRRIATTLDGTPVRRLVYGDQLRVLAEVGDDGRVVARFVREADALTPDVVERDGRSYLVVVDHVGSPRLLIDGANGAIVQELAYDVLGATTVDTNPGLHPFGFAGGIVEPVTGLVRFGMRDYDPATGRWLTRDPLSFWGGMTNLYGYAAHDPVNHVDPTGMQVELCKAPANMGAVVETIFPGAEHWWLKTADVEAGMGPHPTKGGLETAIVDHAGRQGDCEEVLHVDEECVNSHLELDNVHRWKTPEGVFERRYGRDTGGYRPWNTCQSIIDDILTSCQTRHPTIGERIKGFGRREFMGEGSILPQYDTATPKGYERTGEPAVRPQPQSDGPHTPVDGGGEAPYTPADQTPVDGYTAGQGGELWD